MGEGVVLIADDGRIIHANPAAERILDLRASEIESRTYDAPDWDLVDADGNALQVEDSPGPRAMREKVPVRNQVFGIKRPDGSLAWLDCGAAPLLDESGNVMGVVGTFVDITERRLVEQALRDSEASLQSILLSMDDLVFVLDRDRRFASLHQPQHKTRMYPSSQQWIGKPIEEVMPRDFPLLAHEAIDEVCATKAPRQFDYPLRVDGESYWYSAKVSERRTKLGLLTGYTVVARDITERMLAKDALEAAHATLEQRVEERTRELHDLRGQVAKLAAVEERARLARELHDSVSQTLFSISLIADALPVVWERDSTEGHERLDELRRLTRGALAEMRGLLLELRPAALMDADLSELLSQLAAGIESRTGLSVEVDIDEQLTASSDVKIALFRIAQEALNNVVRHADASRASLRLQRCQGRLMLTVEDDGRGFDDGNTPVESMGLAIMRERAEGVGAVLEVHTRPGEGTRISLVHENPA